MEHLTRPTLASTQEHKIVDVFLGAVTSYLVFRGLPIFNMIYSCLFYKLLLCRRKGAVYSQQFFFLVVAVHCSCDLVERIECRHRSIYRACIGSTNVHTRYWIVEQQSTQRSNNTCYQSFLNQLRFRRCPYADHEPHRSYPNSLPNTISYSKLLRCHY